MSKYVQFRKDLVQKHKKMRILQYIPTIDENSGGLGAYMQLLTRDLGALIELHILTHHTNNERKLENCTIHYIGEGWLPWNSEKGEFLSILKEINPDIYHTNSCWLPLTALTAMWAKDAGYKVIYTTHGMLEPYAINRHYWTKKLPAILLFQKKGIAICDLVHATADTEKQNLINLGWNKNVHVIANCVQIDEITMKTSWKSNKNILFLSRVHPKKGINFLIEAIAQLKDEIAEYTITIAGPGEDFYVADLKALAQKYDVVDMFDFVGPVFGSGKWPFYQKADLFVLPTYSENFGIVVTEALASGTPVISTFGTPWIELNDLNCGWCVETGTDPLVSALLKFLKCSEANLELMGRTGRKLVEDKYASTTVAKQFVEMYEELVKT